MSETHGRIGAVVAGLLAASACATPAVQAGDERRAGAVVHANPEELHSNPAFSQVVWIDGPARTVYVGGQNAVDAEGNIIGEGDVGAQGEQVALNLRIALEAAGARVENVVKWTVYAVEGVPMGPAMGGFRRVLGILPEPPAISVVFVSALAHPSFLLEVEAVAVVPEPRAPRTPEATRDE